MLTKKRFDDLIRQAEKPVKQSRLFVCYSPEELALLNTIYSATWGREAKFGDSVKIRLDYVTIVEDTRTKPSQISKRFTLGVDLASGNDRTVFHPNNGWIK